MTRSELKSCTFRANAFPNNIHTFLCLQRLNTILDTVVTFIDGSNLLGNCFTVTKVAITHFASYVRKNMTYSETSRSDNTIIMDTAFRNCNFIPILNCVTETGSLDNPSFTGSQNFLTIVLLRRFRAFVNTDVTIFSPGVYNCVTQIVVASVTLRVAVTQRLGENRTDAVFGLDNKPVFCKFL
ncbi:hypothetical protein TcasGA2_TC005728 [Tribolium castaneum]|uniref:Uncharacterized protein n=1 Tax=Tribolium castaneum TaxID=7070 RepID=D6WWK5_TRICA|nr:hypothetical protein TcasGA2_TC005728 [Tribolium castaneum]